MESWSRITKKVNRFLRKSMNGNQSAGFDRRQVSLVYKTTLLRILFYLKKSVFPSYQRKANDSTLAYAPPPNPPLNSDPACIVFRSFSCSVFLGFVQRLGAGGAG